MTLIVGNFKEGKLAVDKLVIEQDKRTKHISFFKRKHESKIVFTEDKYFCYVFDFKQREDLINIFLNHIKAFEEGILDPDFNLVLPELKDDVAGTSVMIVTKRAAYEVFIGKDEPFITQTDSWFGNKKTSNTILETLDLTVEEVFSCLAGCGNYCCGEMEIVNFKNKLKLIPKKKEGKKK